MTFFHKAVIQAGALVASFILAVLMVAFVLGEIDPMAWEAGGRFAALLLALLLAPIGLMVAGAAINAIEKELTNG